MSAVRDADRDQPLPTPGQQPVQDALIGAVQERRAYGIRKYGRPLETHNGRDALTDAWEEALDLVTYLTQMRLERGDQLPAATPAARAPSREQLANTLAVADGWEVADGLSLADMSASLQNKYLALANAAMRVLAAEPAAHADRPAVLREAAAAVWAMDYDEDANDYGFDSIKDAWDGGTMDASKHLRRMADATSGPGRMADEAQQDGKSTTDKAADLGLTDAEYRAGSHAASVAAVRAAIPGMYAHVGFRLEDILNEADEAQQPDEEATP
jgi:hypothetical protein